MVFPVRKGSDEERLQLLAGLISMRSTEQHLCCVEDGQLVFRMMKPVVTLYTDRC